MAGNVTGRIATPLDKAPAAEGGSPMRVFLVLAVTSFAIGLVLGGVPWWSLAQVAAAGFGVALVVLVIRDLTR